MANRQPYLLLNLVISHWISPNLIESHWSSSNPAKSHHISQNLTISHQISPNLIKCTNLNEFHHSSPNLTESYIWLNHTKSHHIALILTKSHHISPKLNVKVELHVKQYHGGEHVWVFSTAIFVTYLNNRSTDWRWKGGLAGKWLILS